MLSPMRFSWTKNADEANYENLYYRKIAAEFCTLTSTRPHSGGTMEKSGICAGKVHHRGIAEDMSGMRPSRKVTPLAPHGRPSTGRDFPARRMDLRASVLPLLFLLAVCLVPLHEAAALQNEAGFMEIEPVSFYFHKTGSRLNLTSSTARLWYVFQTANDDPAQKPLFVFFNGGPGSATSTALLSFNTSRMTVDSELNGGEAIGANPVSWTRFGNLLYIDARETGFSYNLMSNPKSRSARDRQFDAQNCNPFIDGADFVRVILRFLSDHPTIQKNPVVIVGESYGGIRATVMLHMLLNYRSYANGRQTYQDESLVKEIQSHFDAVFPTFKDRAVPPGVIAEQFGRQILIDPVVSIGYQDGVTGRMFEKRGSIIYQIAEEEGVTYTPCSRQKGSCDPYENALEFVDSVALRDIYDYARPRDWMMDRFSEAKQKLVYTDNLSRLIGTDVFSVDNMYATTRGKAYRVIDTAYDGGLSSESGSVIQSEKESKLPLIERLRRASMTRSLAKTAAAAGDLTDVFGTLKKWDRYLLDLNEDVNNAFFDNKAIDKGYAIDPYHTRFGRMFLKNVIDVKTFITNAALDLVVYSAATPKALALHTNVLASVTHDVRARSGVARPGWMTLKYKAGAFEDVSGVTKRTIRFPLYSKSCHSVPVTQPRELFWDVVRWMGEN